MQQNTERGYGLTLHSRWPISNRQHNTLVKQCAYFIDWKGTKKLLRKHFFMNKIPIALVFMAQYIFASTYNELMPKTQI